MFPKKIKQLNNSELSIFCKQLGMVISAGLPAYQGISILMEDTDDKATLTLLSSLFVPMQQGISFSLALREVQCFPDYLIHMIELGEETGRLEEALTSLTFYYDREASIRSSIKHAVTYPLLMILMMLTVLLVLITKILPIFSQIYEELGSEITGFGQTLIEISSFLNHHMMVFVFIFLLFAALCVLLFHLPIARHLFFGRKLPMQVASSRFANCMYLVLASGLDTDEGLSLASQLVNNPHMQKKISHCQSLIRDGDGFTQSILLAGIFSRVYSSWITIGAVTGNMDEVMKQICKSYEEQIDEAIERDISILEPAFVIVISVLIGLILISFLLPLLAIISSIG